uniref:M48 family metallopeptidase n=1 Tax=Thaumasiovibrio occultus TaxID=1891184 RepID=UPI00131EC4C9|nr:M48 family metallopeptidase [Thaumasiovibrio occultus]
MTVEREAHRHLPFDGEGFIAGNSTCYPVRVGFVDSRLLVEFDDKLYDLSLADVTIESPIGASAPYMIYLQDNTLIKVANLPAFRQALTQREVKANREFAFTWGDYRKGIVISLCGAIVVGVTFIQLIVPLLVQGIVKIIPQELVMALDKETLASLDEIYRPSRIDAEQKQLLQQRFDQAVALSECEYKYPPQLELRRGGFNAFALPGGTVVLLDELVNQLGESPALEAVVLHELAHVCYQDGLYGMVNDSWYQFIIELVIGGNSIVDSSQAEAVLSASYSRDLETRADLFSAYHVQQAYGNTAPMLDLFDALDANGGGSGLPWLSSHPHTRDRRNSVIIPPESLDF